MKRTHDPIGTWRDATGRLRCHACGLSYRSTHACKATCDRGEVYPTVKRDAPTNDSQCGRCGRIGVITSVCPCARTFIAFYNRASEQEKAFMRSGVGMSDILYIRTKTNEA